jgi:hypothetical protein
MTKQCKICLVEKDETSFHFTNSENKYRRGLCIECEKARDKERRQSEEYKIRVNNYYRKESSREKNRERSKKYRENNPDKIKEGRIKWSNNTKKYDWKINNSDKVKEYRKLYSQRPKCKMADSVRRRIKKYLKLKNLTKNNKTFDIIGCTPTELKVYLESLFTTGMSWDNYGLYGWHIDHKKPLSSAKTEEELLTLCHFTNLQPLWAKDNLTKSSKIL